MSFKILIADDEAHILHVLSMKLKNAGFVVVTAMDGEEALELCQSERPDMLITDNQMPFLTGMELATQVHQIEALKTLPIMLLTARGYDLTNEDIAAAGIAAVLAKPFSPREVLEKVATFLGQPLPSCVPE